MTELRTQQGGFHRKAAAVALLVVLYAGLGLFFRICLGKTSVYMHLGYVPIVLAGFWWGFRGAAVVAPLAVVPVLMSVLASGGEGLAEDAARIGFFLAAAAVVGAISHRTAQSRAALASSEERYRRVIEKSLSGIYVYRGERVVFANSTLSRMLGYAEGELYGMSIWSILCADEHQRIRDLVMKRGEKGATDLRYETRYRRKDGGELFVDSASSITEFDGDSAVIVNIYDITARKEAEAAEKRLLSLSKAQEEQLIHSTRLAEMGEMVAGVAHEISQPLTGIRNFARNTIYMVEEGAGKPADVVENLNMISLQVDRASAIIGKMKELARKTDAALEPLDVCEAAIQTLALLEPETRRARIEVRASLPAGLPKALGDKTRIGQVFLNLVNNAIHAMEGRETRTLDVSAREIPGPPRAVAVEIADSGTGFGPAVRDRLFTPFFTTKEPGKGTGLGLSISLKIVKDHGGSIDASGSPGRGAKFTVVLPAISTS